ncbi:MAG: hypothetical protein JEY79_01060 [Pseudodesulfovibrio sp.]|nr:hypothetical protein [Pseudodesulfovibrio sp.]
MCGSMADFFPKDMSMFEKIVAGGTAAAAVGTTAAGFMQKTPKAQSFSAAPNPTEADSDAANEASAKARQRALATRGKKSTNVTGGMGLTTPANTGLKMLFGGK